MGQNWYFARNNQQQGPVSLEQLQTMVAQGTIAQGDLVWTDGMAAWAPAASVPQLFPTGAPPAAANLLGYFQRPTQFVYAGFWLRFVAALLDGLILLIPSFIVGVMVGSVLGAAGSSREFIQFIAQLAALTMSWLYFALQESSETQATIGKKVLGLRVTDLSGGRISFARASGRYFGKIVSYIILLIGFIMAAFTARKQALHDIMADCLVVRITA